MKFKKTLKETFNESLVTTKSGYLIKRIALFVTKQVRYVVARLMQKLYTKSKLLILGKTGTVEERLTEDSIEPM
jgi:hypothetical protein